MYVRFIGMQKQKLMIMTLQWSQVVVRLLLVLHSKDFYYQVFYKVFQGMGLKMKQQNGFTLVELAIALMVIGLLIGGVLKGQELIENARIIRTIKDLKDYDTAVMVFRNTYNALPGDMKKPGSRLPNCLSEFCNFTATTYTGDQKINIVNEIRGFWIHLERAGLLTGITEKEDRYSVSPMNALGGYTVAYWTGQLGGATSTAEYPHANYYRIGDSAKGGEESNRVKDCTRARIIDEKTDDGKPMTGSVKLYVAETNCYDEDTLEYISHPTDRPYLLIKSDTLN